MPNFPSGRLAKLVSTVSLAGVAAAGVGSTLSASAALGRALDSVAMPASASYDTDSQGGPEQSAALGRALDTVAMPPSAAYETVSHGGPEQNAIFAEALAAVEVPDAAAYSTAS